MAPRVAPTDRFDQLLRTAQELFARDGFDQTQMDDVASAMGVSKGTLYRYVESKEALLAAVVGSLASTLRPIAEPALLPVRSPGMAEVVDAVARSIEAKVATPRLDAATRQKRPRPARIHDEVREIVEELLSLLEANRHEIRFVERCAHDLPALAEIWYREGRVRIMEKVAAYLEKRSQQGLIPASEDIRVQARLVLETLTMWAVHRLGDPAPQQIDEARAHRILVRFVSHGILEGEDG